jgi:eukaryotic-like serine/threonine-protein kinase
MRLPRPTAGEPSAPAPLLFGPFALDADTGELRKHGLRVRLSGQPVQILLLLLANPGGLVTREELRERLWSEGTFVDFEHGVNAAINKLRRTLGDSAERPRYVETVPGRGYRFIGSLERAPEPVPPMAGSAPEESSITGRRRNRSLTVAAIGAVAALPLLMTLSWRDDAPSDPSPWKVVRLTADTGISDYPALSPDGRLLAYSSDAEARGDHDVSDGGTDLYVKQVAGSSPIRLTFDGAGNTMPDFSPDGSRIVFRSNREGGGIFEMPALGGEARFVVKNGFNPRFSPDGSHVAYWVGPRSVAATVPGNGEVWVVPVAGGPPRRVGAGFTTARYPVWHPEGRHLLIVGYASTRAFDSSAIDWWLVATDDSTAVRTGAYEALRRARIEPGDSRRTPVRTIPQPSCWSSQSGNVTFSMVQGDSSNLWQVEVSTRTGKVVGSPERLTTGAGSDVRASCASRGDIVFAKVETRRDVWLLPFDVNLGTSTGVPARMTHGLPSHDNPSLAKDGRFVAFTSERSGRGNIWRRDLATGKDVQVAPSSFVQRYPVSDASGDSVAFSVYEQDTRVVYLATPGGEAQKVCDGCLRATDWSLDGKTLVVMSGNPTQISLLNVASRRQVPLVTSALNVLYGRLSPDNHWISFTVREGPSRSRIVIAPVDGSKPVPESSWIAIAEVESDDYANWSPDGGTLYFTSSTDGYACVWGQRLETGSLRPLGESFAVQHFHGRVHFDHGGWSAAAGSIAIPLVEKTGNVWMMTRPMRGESNNTRAVALASHAIRAHTD